MWIAKSRRPRTANWVAWRDLSKTWRLGPVQVASLVHTVVHVFCRLVDSNRGSPDPIQGTTGVEMVQISPIEFGKRTADGTPRGNFDYASYFATPFACACDEVHELKPWMEIVRELPLFRFVVACPKGRHLTLVKARWSREAGVRVLESELGTELSERRSSRLGIEFQAGLLEAKTGRPWSLEETETFMDLHYSVAKLRRRVGAG